MNIILLILLASQTFYLFRLKADIKMLKDGNVNLKDDIRLLDGNSKNKDALIDEREDYIKRLSRQIHNLLHNKGASDEGPFKLY